MSARAVTGLGMRLREMRLLVHRGQALLLLVVGVLAGVAVAAAVLERDGVPWLRVSELFAPSRPGLPAQIVIGRAVVPSDDGGLAGTATTAAGPGAAEPAPPATVRPTITTAVVPGTVYSYPPDDHRHDGGPGGPSPGGGGPSPGGGGGTRGGGGG